MNKGKEKGNSNHRRAKIIKSDGNNGKRWKRRQFSKFVQTAMPNAKPVFPVKAIVCRFGC